MKSLCFYNGNNKLLLSKSIESVLKNNKVVLLCIGTDRVTGDCLGPLCGQMLTRVYNIPAFVYGTLNFPVNAKNLLQIEKFIRKNHSDCKILAIDSSLGSASNVGLVQFGKGPISTGSAIRREGMNVGDYFITAIINTGSLSNNSSLFSTRLKFVNDAAEMISSAIAHAMQSTMHNAQCTTHNFG